MVCLAGRSQGCFRIEKTFIDPALGKCMFTATVKYEEEANYIN